MSLKTLPLFAGAAVALSACVIIVDNDDDDDDYRKKDKVEDSCGMGDYESLVGTPISAVTIPAETPHRILRPGEAMTMDYRAERLNIELDDDGNIKRVFCG